VQERWQLTEIRHHYSVAYIKGKQEHFSLSYVVTDRTSAALKCGGVALCQLGDGAGESISPYPSQVPDSDKVPSFQTNATTHGFLSSTGIQKNMSIKFLYLLV